MESNEMKEGKRISVKLKESEFSLIRNKKLCSPNIIKAAVAGKLIFTPDELDALIGSMAKEENQNTDLKMQKEIKLLRNNLESILEDYILNNEEE